MNQGRTHGNEAGGDDGEALADLAWDAFEQGDPESALDLAGGLDDDDPERAVIEIAARLELDDLDGARRTLAEARRIARIEDHVDLCWSAGELALREWDLAEAERLYRRTVELDETPAAHGRLALCADARGDFAGADAHLRRAQELDAEGWTPPPRLSEEELGEVLDEAIGQLDPGFQEAIEETPILIEPMPRRELIDAANPAETPPDMLGLFVGSSRLERSPDGAEPPPSIHIFQRNLERAAADREDLVRELRVTLYHEIGHMLGFDEEGVDRMGLA